MGIVIRVWREVNQLWQRAGSQISLQNAERHHVLRLRTGVYNVTQIDKRIVVLEIRIDVIAEISSIGQALRIGFPGFSRGKRGTNNVVVSDGSGKGVVIGFNLPDGEHEVISDGWMRVGKKVCRQ